ncbi:hypothetical protein DB88DRAFT_494496 [Papiliotrema laurentii]|uniref:Uncharacterized protein n=1 Tax=Papiliotrema laurentii TaxID=5418 RepID=A0AAD9D1S9_PAPLA|nr:hypothetical protein DB88DRAFT_494496 [Papiliotrema laurentii]
MFGGRNSPPGGRDRDMKRQTEFITHPMSFSRPRPAPKPTGSILRESVDGPTYTSSTQRFHGRENSFASTPAASSLGDDEMDQRASRGVGGHRLIVQNASIGTGTDTDESVSPAHTPPGTLRPGASQVKLPSPLRQDFSRPRPDSTAHTLPSLYEPPAGAPTFRETTYTSYSAATDNAHDRYSSSDRPETLLSLPSRYAAAERHSTASTIGAALGSGRRTDQNFWSRQELPPVPRSVSHEST